MATSAMLPSYCFERHVFDMFRRTEHVNGSPWPLHAAVVAFRWARLQHGPLDSTRGRITVATSATLPSWRFGVHVLGMLRWTVHVKRSMWPILHCYCRSVSMEMSMTCSAGKYTSKDLSGQFCNAAVLAFPRKCLRHVPLNITRCFLKNTRHIQIGTHFENGRGWLNQLLLWRVHKLGCLSTDSVHPFPSSIRVTVQVYAKMHDEINRDQLTLFFCAAGR